MVWVPHAGRGRANGHYAGKVHIKNTRVSPGLVSEQSRRALMTLQVSGRRLRRLIKAYATVTLFADRGRDFVFDPDGTYSYGSIPVGNHVNLGVGPTLLATRSKNLDRQPCLVRSKRYDPRRKPPV